MNDGGPAFPTGYSDKVHTPQGMSLLDWFAGQALTGMIAIGAGYGNEDKRSDLAYHAYAVAEAMLIQRKIVAADKAS